MKLPNYNKSKIWIDLFDQMNINTIRKFDSPKYLKTKNIKRSLELKKGISITSIKEVEQSINSKDQSLQDAKTGQKLVFHIKDIIPEQKLGYRSIYKLRNGQQFSFNLPRYHIANCSTIQAFKKNKKFDTRYVMVSGGNGSFVVIHPYSRKEEKKELTLCLNCRNLMARTHKHEMFRRPPSKFSLVEYHEKFDEVKESILNKISSNYDQNYTPKKRSINWSSISSSYREKVGWTCEICNVCYRSNRKLLETHHKDGDRSNDNEDNLKALCRDCHKLQPGHSGWISQTNDNKKKDKNIAESKPLDINHLKKEYRKKVGSTKEAIKSGEGQTVEFKRTLLAGQKPQSIIAKSMVFNIFKSIAAFLNTDGGKLIIGVDDEGNIIGLDEIGKQFKNYDQMDLFFSASFNNYLQGHLRDYCKWKLETIDGKDIFVINVDKYTHQPVPMPLTKNEKYKVGDNITNLTLPIQGADSEVVIRSGAGKTTLKTPTSLINYYRRRFPNYYKLMIDIKDA